jgi:hypothetical protein
MSEFLIVVAVLAIVVGLFVGKFGAAMAHEDKLDRRAYFNERMRMDMRVLERRMAELEVLQQMAHRDGDRLMADWCRHLLWAPISPDDPELLANKKLADSVFYPNGGAPA